MHARSFHVAVPLLAVAAFFGGCGQGSSVLTPTTSTSAALATAQCASGTFTAQDTACFTTFDTCRSAEGADLAACRAALEACLPKPPQGPRGQGGGCDGDADGGMRGGHRGPGGHGGAPPGEGAGGRPPRDADGGLAPPRGGRGPTPDSAEITACHDALRACLDGATDAATCFATERSCAHAAFDAAFAAACADAQTGCAASGADAIECAEIVQRCTEGVDGRPGASDGGVCQ